MTEGKDEFVRWLPDSRPKYLPMCLCTRRCDGGDSEGVAHERPDAGGVRWGLGAVEQLRVLPGVERCPSPRLALKRCSQAVEARGAQEPESGWTSRPPSGVAHHSGATRCLADGGQSGKWEVERRKELLDSVRGNFGDSGALTACVLPNFKRRRLCVHPTSEPARRLTLEHDGGRRALTLRSSAPSSSLASCLLHVSRRVYPQHCRGPWLDHAAII